MLTLLFLLACTPDPLLLKPDDLVEEDTAAAGDTAAEALPDVEAPGAPCDELTAEPSALTWSWPASAADVQLRGCVRTLEVSCPAWLSVSAPDEVLVEAVLQLEPVPGSSGPLEGVCTVGGVPVAVELDAS